MTTSPTNTRRSVARKSIHRIRTHLPTDPPKTNERRQADGSGELKKEFITHTVAYNYKIVSDPPGLPIIFEEVTCQVRKMCT